MKANLYGYSRVGKRPFLKILCGSHEAMNRIKGALEKGSVSFGPRYNHSQPHATFESNIPQVLQFMVDCHIVGMNWIELPAGAYRLVPPMQGMSTAQIEVDIQ